MKIISPFRDYYDTALAHGFDAERPWRRETDLREVPSPSVHWTGPAAGAPLPLHLSLLAAWAGSCAACERAGIPKKHNPDPRERWFCSFPLAFMVGSRPIKALWLRVHEPLRGAPAPQGAPSAEPVACLPRGAPPAGRHAVFDGPVFDVETLRHWIGPWLALSNSKDPRPRASDWIHWMGSPRAARRGLAAQADWLANEPPPLGLQAAMAASGRACAVAGSGQAASDPRLADYQLFRALDPCACLQEIAMAVGNMAAPVKEPEPLADLHRIAAHGFDRASFRKQPTKTLAPRRAKRPHPDRRP